MDGSKGPPLTTNSAPFRQTQYIFYFMHAPIPPAFSCTSVGVWWTFFDVCLSVSVLNVCLCAGGAAFVLQSKTITPLCP